MADLFTSPLGRGSNDLTQAVSDSGLLERAKIARTDDERQEIKEEFLSLFYKEVLKNFIHPPQISLSDEKEASMGSLFASDMLVNQMALELARSKAFSAADLFPDQNLKTGGL
ncbi:hypothetical protein HZB07_00770 [Candidatus Saganbacteria bacterium]|nr:hypothetical protein [Candidatus Saganbacteria bacterium]